MSTTKSWSLVRTAHRATFAGLALAALLSGAIGSAHADASPAAPAASSTSTSAAPADQPAQRGVPDIGRPGDRVDPQAVTVAPDGTRVLSSPTSPRATTAAAARSSWLWAETSASGVRIRTFPTTGTIVGLLPAKGTEFLVQCKTKALDGYYWGYVYAAGHYGWIRQDLWYQIQFTGPGGVYTPPVPRC